jgi:hypothetical protein
MDKLWRARHNSHNHKAALLLEITDRQFELIDLRIQLLGGPAKARPTENGQLALSFSRRI